MALSLPAGPHAPARARRVVKNELTGLVAAEALLDIVLVVSELVSNAVIYGRGEIRLRLTWDGRVASGEVSDEGGSFGVPESTRGPNPLGGQGLHVVDEVTARWGVDEARSRVWFEIAAAAQA